MTEEQAIEIIRGLEDLVVGDMIEAWHNGRRYNRGKVLQTVPSMGMFWILDTGSGIRKLVDFESLLIRRLPEKERRDNASVA
jgi:hypothetical protein